WRICARSATSSAKASRFPRSKRTSRDAAAPHRRADGGLSNRLGKAAPSVRRTGHERPSRAAPARDAGHGGRAALDAGAALRSGFLPPAWAREGGIAMAAQIAAVTAKEKLTQACRAQLEQGEAGQVQTVVVRTRAERQIDAEARALLDIVHGEKLATRQ